MIIEYEKSELFQFFQKNSDFLKLISILLAISGLILSFSNKFPDSDNIFWVVVCLLIVCGIILFFITLDGMNRLTNKKIESAIDILDVSLIFITIVMILAPITLIGGLIFENKPDQIYWGLFGFFFYLIILVFAGIMEFIDVKIAQKNDALIFLGVFILLTLIVIFLSLSFSKNVLFPLANVLLIVELLIGLSLSSAHCILKIKKI
jgi:hypothetical protein